MILIMIFVMSYTHFFLSWLLPVFYPVIISNSIFFKAYNRAGLSCRLTILIKNRAATLLQLFELNLCRFRCILSFDIVQYIICVHVI